MLQIAYIHDHECYRKGEKVVVRPDSFDGVSQIVPLVCEETMIELRRIGIEHVDALARVIPNHLRHCPTSGYHTPHTWDPDDNPSIQPRYYCDGKCL